MKFVFIIAGVLFVAKAALGQGAIYLDNSQSANGLALNAPSNYYSGTFGLEVWELNSANVPTNINVASPFAAYTNLIADGFILETAFTNQTTASPGVFQLGQVTLPHVNPPGSTVTLALVAWAGTAPDYSNAVAQSASLGVVGFANPTSLTNGTAPYLTGWSNQDLVMLSFTNYTLIINPGWTMIANQLENPNGNSLDTIILNNVSPALPDGTQIFKFINNSPSAFPWATASYNKKLSMWIPNNISLNPGEGAFLFNPSGSPFSISFTGLGLLPRSTPYTFTSGHLFYLLSDQACEPSSYDLMMGVPPDEGSIVDQLRGTNYQQSIYFRNKTSGTTNWVPVAPALAIGESAWVLPRESSQYLSPAPPAPVVLSVALTNGVAAVLWNTVPLPSEGSGLAEWFPQEDFFLESSPDLGNWTVISNATSPWTIDLSTNASPQLFFRILEQPYN